jgi:GNAT superfamily N-acetyltransferase
MEIKKTNLKDLLEINQLISDSKSFWNYDKEYLNSAIPLIQVSKAWLQEFEGYTLYDSKDICGFLGFEFKEGKCKLEHLWVKVEKIRKGLGSKAIIFMLEKARKRNIQNIYVFPDPPAEGFYLKLGAKYTNVVVTSRVTNGPEYREMVFQIN